jgi:hypothetical protein
VFAAMADAIHNRNDSFPMNTAPQSDPHVLGIKKVCSGKMFDVFETLDWDRMPPTLSFPKNVMRTTSAKYREAFSLLNDSRDKLTGYLRLQLEDAIGLICDA